jgi:AbrB family looped-hinge helix DNA binding protein
MPEYLHIRGNGQITLPASTRRKTKLEEGDLLDVVVEKDGSILLIPKVAVDLVLAEKYQLAGIDWAAKEKGKKK